MTELINPKNWLVIGAIVAFFWAVMQLFAWIGGAMSGTPAPEISFESSGSTTIIYESGQMLETAASFELIEASRRSGGAVAYWEADSDGSSCFFGIDTGDAWAANALPGPCPTGPDDSGRISELIQQLWDSFTKQSWSDLLALGGKAAKHVEAIIQLARAYGVSLTP